MAFPLTLAQGHHLLSEPLVHWDAPLPSNTPHPSVVLTASILSGPAIPIFPPLQGHTATTLAIQMGAEVAMQLYEKLGELGRSMGWLPQPEAGPLT